MHIYEFRNKISDIYNTICSLKEEINDSQKLNYLSNVFEFIEIFYTFSSDERNLKLLKKYYGSEKVCSLCPLDMLCYSIKDKIDDISSVLYDEIFSKNNYSSNDYRNVKNRTDFENKIKDQKFINLLKSFEVLRNLDGYNKTLIILGPNGSGKTSFAKYLKGLEEHIKVIPASKPIIATGHIPSIYNSTIENYNSNLYSGEKLEEAILQRLIIGLCSEHDNAARKHRDTGERGENTTYEKIKEIFDDFFEVKLDNSAFAAKEMQAIKNGGTAFKFNEMSDGERVAFFYIATVITAPRSSFIIVDEPENHLNPAIYNKIWDRLIESRPDCQFIFISHTIDFIRARSNFELVKIKKFVHPNEFDFEFLGSSLKDIKSEHIVEILGSRKDFLFCEGTKDSFDYKVYEILFGERYTVIPTGTCSSVKISVEACNMNAINYSIQSAIGIIDSDLKDDIEIERLKNKKIYTLKCNEIEMLLLDDKIFKKILGSVGELESKFDDFKDIFMNKILEKKYDIVRRIAKTCIDDKLGRMMIDDMNNQTKDEIKENLNRIFSDIDIDGIWSNFDTNIDTVLRENSYDDALRICCLEHHDVVGKITEQFVPDYTSIALKLLKEDADLATTIRLKYFSDVQMDI